MRNIKIALYSNVFPIGFCMFITLTRVNLEYPCNYSGSETFLCNKASHLTEINLKSYFYLKKLSEISVLFLILILLQAGLEIVKIRANSIQDFNRVKML